MCSFSAVFRNFWWYFFIRYDIIRSEPLCQSVTRRFGGGGSGSTGGGGERRIPAWFSIYVGFAPPYLLAMCVCEEGGCWRCLVSIFRLCDFFFCVCVFFVGWCGVILSRVCWSCLFFFLRVYPGLFVFPPPLFLCLSLWSLAGASYRPRHAEQLVFTEMVAECLAIVSPLFYLSLYRASVDG